MPGAGTPPPELVGRDELIERIEIVLDRAKLGRVDHSAVLYGLRGVGKTVLLNKLQVDAQSRGFYTVMVEAPEKKSLTLEMLPALRKTLLELSDTQHAKALALKAVRALGGFVRSLKLRFNDLEVGLDLPTEAGLADSGHLAHDFGQLICAAGDAAKEQETAVVLFVDEIQHAPQEELAAFITALHACAQRQLPVVLVGAGLPQVLGLMGDAKSYAERLFEFIPVDRLDKTNAESAINVPAQRESVEFNQDALDEIVTQTSGYPYFLQAWGKHAWNIAQNTPITIEDAKKTTRHAVNDLDASFFRVRIDRLTKAEKHYVRAMAELGPGPHRSGDIAACLGRKVESVAPVRSSLIRKGMVYSPNHGDTAFTVPMFDAYMRRAIPDFKQI